MGGKEYTNGRTVTEGRSRRESAGGGRKGRKEGGNLHKEELGVCALGFTVHRGSFNSWHVCMGWHARVSN